MKCEIPTTKTVEVKSVRVSLAVRYEEEDIPNDFPLRTGDMWNAIINIDTGKILDWPQGKTAILAMKVCDEGSYYLLDEEGKQLATIEQDYVPHGVIPGKYGDYVELMIGADGTITNWPRNPDVSAFFAERD